MNANMAWTIASNYVSALDNELEAVVSCIKNAASIGGFCTSYPVLSPETMPFIMAFLRNDGYTCTILDGYPAETPMIRISWIKEDEAQ